MTDATPRLALPFLAPGQAQKEMSHNEALALLDIAVQGAVTGGPLDTPPVDPQAGECWIVGSAPSGVWLSHAHALAGWTAGGWRFVLPREGMRVWLGENSGFALFSGGEWRLSELHGKLFVEGVQVVGPQSDFIVEPAGGEVVDAEARAAISAVLGALRAHGLVAAD